METKKEMNTVVAVVICLIVAGFLFFISIHNKTNMADQKNTNNSSGELSGQVVGSDNEQVAKAGDTVAMSYTGRLADGTVFDSNVDPKFNHVEPFVFTLGAGQVIPGWDKGIIGMKVGEKKTLTIAPEDAYGAQGVGPIPPNSTLTFEVELLAIK